MQDNTKAGRPAQGDELTAGVLDEFRRGLPRHGVGGNVGRGAGLRRELEDDPVVARLMRDPYRGELHGWPAFRTAAVIDATKRAEISGAGLGREGRWGSRGRS